MPRRFFALILLLVANTAAATIIPGRGIAGVALGMTEAQVRAELGGPLRTTRPRGALGFVVTRLHYAHVVIDLQRLDNTLVVIRVLTTSPDETTTSGVGVGSPLADLKRLPGAHRWWEGSAHYCGIGSRHRPLGHFTLFWIGAHARVTLIEVLLNANS